MMQRFSLPDRKYFCQDSETSLEAFFKSKSRPAWNFTRPKKTTFMHRKSLQTEIFFYLQSEKTRKAC